MKTKFYTLGETRTFAEILDKEVEKIVLFYLTTQGRLCVYWYNLKRFQIAIIETILLFRYLRVRSFVQTYCNCCLRQVIWRPNCGE
jgi:hypothetical protein